MKLELILQLAVFGGLVLVTSFAYSNGEPQQQPRIGEQLSARANFVMPKLFDFKAFTERFQKRYPNAVELVRRAKIFMTRAFAVFISSINYLKRRATKFLKLNSRSDSTPEEREASSNHSPLPVFPQTNLRSRRNVRDPRPAVDRKEVELKLAEIGAHNEENPDYAALAAALDRRRRSVDPPASGGRKLSMEQLMGGLAQQIKVSPKYTPTVPSNNPLYEQIEASSLGAYDEKQVNPIALQEAKRIDHQASLGGYLGGLLNSVVSTAGYFLGGNDQTMSLQDSGGEMVVREFIKDELDRVYLDYRDTKCLLQPKDQLRCGSCFIFAITALMEYHHCRQTGKLVPFSEQYPVDCGQSRIVVQNPHEFTGCRGGKEKYAGEFYGKYGLELSVNYPFKGSVQTCPYSSSTEPAAMGHTKMEQPQVVDFDMYQATSELITQLLMQEGPLYISVRISDDFYDFGGGVDLNLCDTQKPDSHAMALIGHGIEDGIEYWLMRNSYNMDYGEQGHYKMATDFKFGCVGGFGYVRGQFKENKSYQGRTVLDELKKKSLLAKFGSVPSNIYANQIEECEKTYHGLLERIVPIHYQGHIDVSNEDFIYNATMKIWIRASEAKGEPDNVIVLHADKSLDITEVKAVSFNNALPISVTKLCRNSAKQLLVIVLKESLPADSLNVVDVKFRVAIRDDGIGLNKLINSDYKSNAVVWANLKNSSVRWVFPCFDDDKFKANFELNLDHDHNLHVDSDHLWTNRTDQPPYGERVITKVFYQKPISLGDLTFEIRPYVKGIQNTLLPEHHTGE